MSNSQCLGLPGQSGNPLGYAGPRERKKKEVFKLIEGLNHDDALVTLSTLQNDKTADPGLRIAAASALAPYCHPKMQPTPTPRYVELQIDVPEFTSVSIAEDFLARILSLVARGHLDIQQGQELAALAKMYIDTQYARDELQFKINPPAERDQTIQITGGLPALPGTTITMPVLNGRAVSEQLLSAPTDVVPSEDPPTEFSPAELKAQGPHSLQKHHFAASPEETAHGQGPETNDGGPA